MTIMELADAIGYAAYSHISEIETGKREPSLRFALKISQFFNVTTDQLLRDDLEVGE
jgi:transcriptional regulator with XRE-family HTH domain